MRGYAARIPICEEAEAGASGDPPALLASARAAGVASEAAALAFRLLSGEGALEGLERRGRVEVQQGDAAVPSAIAVTGVGGLVLKTEAARFDGRAPFAVLVRARLPQDARGVLLARMEPQRDYLGWDILLDGRRPQVYLISRWPVDAIKVIARGALPAEQWFALEVTYDGSGAAEGLQLWLDGRRLAVDVERGRLSGSAASAAPLRVGSHDGGEWLADYAIAEVRIWEGESARLRPLHLALRARDGAGDAAATRKLARA